MSTASNGFTAEQLREQLFHSMRKKGILNSLKSQLRHTLVRELKHSFPSGGQPATPTPSLWLQAANSLVADHLKRSGYEYTLSTFAPEAGINIDKLLSPEDIVQVLGLTPDHPLLLHLSGQSVDNNGMLLNLLQWFPAMQRSSTDCSQATSAQSEEEVQQSTPEQKRTPVSLAAKLYSLEDTFAEQSAAVNDRHQKNIEERMASFQQQCVENSKKQLQTEMRCFREKELSIMKMEVELKHQKELASLRDELEKSYQERLVDAQEGLEEEKRRVRTRGKNMETELYAQRQALLEEMSSLKLKEAELKRQTELHRKAVQSAEDRVNSMQQLLADKEKAVLQLRAHYEEIAATRLERCKYQLETELLARHQQLGQWESQLAAEKQQVTVLRGQCELLLKGQEGEKERMRHLQQQLHEATDQQTILMKEKSQLQVQLDQVSDYHTVKKNVIELEKQVDEKDRRLTDTRYQLEAKISEQQLVIQDLRNKIAIPSPDLEKLQQEVKHSQHEVLVLEYDNRKLKADLTTKDESYYALQHELDELRLQLRSAQRETSDLQNQVNYLQQALVKDLRSLPVSHHHGDVGRKGKLHMSLQAMSPTPARSSISSPLTPKFPSTRGVSQPKQSRESFFQNQSYSDVSAGLLAEARAAFARIEQEAGEFEQTFARNPPLSRPLISAAHSSQYHTTAVAAASSASSSSPSSSLHQPPVSLSPDLSERQQFSYPLSVSALAPVSPLPGDTRVSVSSSGNHSLNGVGVEPTPVTGAVSQAATLAPIVTSVAAISSHTVPVASSEELHLTQSKPVSDEHRVSQMAVPVNETIVTLESTLTTGTTHSSVATATHDTVVPAAPTVPVLSLDSMWKASSTAAISSSVSHTRDTLKSYGKQVREEPFLTEKKEEDEITHEHAKQDPTQPSSPSPSDNRGTETTHSQMSAQKPVVHEESEVDPVMMKYMEIVRKKKQQEQPTVPTQDHTQSHHSISQFSESVEQLSVSSVTDPFEDW